MGDLAFSTDPGGPDVPEEADEQARVDRLVREIRALIERREKGLIAGDRFLALQNEMVREIEEISLRLEREGRPRPEIDPGKD